MKKCKISVIICTRNRAELLDKAIKGVYLQKLPNKDYELIIVDNNSIDSTKQVVDRWYQNFQHFKYIFVKKIGLPYARNAGWESAKSQIVVYLDDDAIPDDNWLINILRTYATYWDNKQFIAVGGGVSLYLVNDLNFPDWLSEELKDYLTRLDYGLKSRVLKNNELLVGANFSVPKIVLEKIGGFNENLYGYGGDERWIEERIKSMGGFLVYSGASYVKHAVTADRLTKEWFFKRFLIEGRAIQRGRTNLRIDNTLRVILRLSKNIVFYIYFCLIKLKYEKRNDEKRFIMICKFYFYKGSIIDLFFTLKKQINIFS